MSWAASTVGGSSSLSRLIAGPRRWLLTALFVLLVFFFASGGPVSIALVLGLIMLYTTIAVASRHPQFAVIGIAFWMPLQVPVLAFAYKHGVPRMVVKDLGYLKEFWAMSLVVAALRASKRRHIKADLLDWMAVGYVGVATLYLILPFADPSALGGFSFGARLSAWRLDCLFVVVFLCIRRLVFDPVVIRRLRIAVFVTAIILAGFALWESIGQAGFNNFLRNTLDYPGYRGRVLGNQLAGANSGSLIATTSSENGTYTRGGSLFNDPLLFGLFMVIPFAVALERAAARRPSVLAMTAAAGSLVGVLLSVTRGAVVSAAFVVLLALAFGVSRVSPRRLRLLLTVCLASVVLLPMAGHSSVVNRMKAIVNPSADSDTQAHVTRTRQGFVDLIGHPLGHGLGTNSATATLYNSDTVITTEDTYLETGNELGIPALAFFVATLGLMLVHLRRRSRQPGEGAALAGGAWLAGCGLSIGGIVLETWYELPVSLVFWTIAGLALANTGTEELPETAASEHRWLE